MSKTEIEEDPAFTFSLYSCSMAVSKLHVIRMQLSATLGYHAGHESSRIANVETVISIQQLSTRSRTTISP